VADVNTNPANPVIGVRSFSSDPTLAANLTGEAVVGYQRQGIVATAIAAHVDSIMTAHIVVPALDPSGDPATLSQPIVTGILRGELG
jgi:beta-N-acetylhexosaminidase